MSEFSKRKAIRCLAEIFLSVCLLATLSSKALAAEWIYIVSDGDNLWNLSEKYLGSALNWRKVQKVNQLPDPNWIRPGTRLRIPMEWIRSNSVPARVKALKGKAKLVQSDGAVSQLQPGSPVHLGDRVQTAPEASITIEFADNTVLNLDGDSELSLDHLSAYGTTGMVDSRLRLLKGRLETQVTPASGPGSRFEIHTASAISAVRGTAYRMAINGPEQLSSVEVTGGVVDVSDTAATEHTLLDKGFGTVVAVGQPPLPPRALLSAPDFNALPEKLDRITWPVGWAPVTAAIKYRLQLADTADFETIRWQKTTEQHRARLPDFPDGVYHLRLRGIDELGLEGLDAVMQLTQDAHPQPPTSLQPVNDALLMERAPQLTWSHSAEAESYHVQISRDPQFEDLVLDESGLDLLEYTEPLTAQPGSWYWRVSSIAADGEHGPFGAVRQFRVKPTPAAPLTKAVSNDRELTISWQPAGARETYRVQMARDRNFKRLIYDEHTADPEVRVGHATGLTRYLRVQAIDSDGDPGAWGAVQEIPALPDNSWRWALGTYLLMVLIAL